MVTATDGEMRGLTVMKKWVGGVGDKNRKPFQISHINSNHVLAQCGDNILSMCCSKNRMLPVAE